MKLTTMIRYFSIISFIYIVFSCQSVGKQQNNQAMPTSTIPSFKADSAYDFIQKQVDFGPRVPNTKAHQLCGEYLAESLKGFGAVLTNQYATLTAFNGDKLQARNIIASFNTEQTNRILLFAHWDTRPWSDHDPDPKNFNKPVLGANDGASGVGVLMEIARQLGKQTPNIGVDIILFDAEDYGAPENYSQYVPNSWCLGSQYWAKNKHQANYHAQYGILLDMVGAPNAKFYREQISDRYAKNIVDKVWNTAHNLGFDRYFINTAGGMITDDHLYINEIAGIPSIDIIQYDSNSQSGFGNYWHTIHDTMDNISKETLFAVGTTLLHVIYNQQ